MEELIGKTIKNVHFKKDSVIFYFHEKGEEKELCYYPTNDLVYFHSSNFETIIGKTIDDISYNQNYITLYSNGRGNSLSLKGIKEIVSVEVSENKHELFIHALLHDYPFRNQTTFIHYFLLNNKWTYSEFSNKHDDDLKKYFLSVDLPYHSSVRMLTVF